MSAGAPIGHVVIVGGGTAGWMVAAAAARFLMDGRRRVTLIESEEIGTVGVGEATIPPIRGFNALLGVDEGEFLRATGGTIKLGIEFVGWGAEGEHYFHPFGRHGVDVQGIAFHQIWLKLRGRDGIGPLSDYAMADRLAADARVDTPDPDPRSPLNGLAYAYHFDAGLYARFLRTRAEAGGVRRIEGRIEGVEHDPANGHVRALALTGGRRIEGDLFIDCSGFRSLLLGDAMGVPFEDWSHWLPCDRALAVPTARTDPLLPFTRATAHPAGWQWRIPLQHRTGNGLVYSSRHLDDDAAERLLLASLESAPTDSPRRLTFLTGRRDRMWEGNVVALGLAAGFLEPLESTSIHLVQLAISALFALFPDRRHLPVERDLFNRQMADAFTGVRDFLILHYHANARREGVLWRELREMPLPESLTRRLALFRNRGRVVRDGDELFVTPNWVAVMLGQNVVPESYDPLVDALDADRLANALRQFRATCAGAARAAPSHEAVLARLGGLAG